MQSAGAWWRCRQMLLGWGSVGLVYGSTSLLQSAPALLPESALDRLIPFDAAGIWLYLSFFALIPVSFALAPPQRLRWLRTAMQCAALACGAVFLAWPTTLAYPSLPGDGLSSTVLSWLIAGDSRQNCLPSLHGALTLLSVWALLDSRRKLRSASAIGWGLAICYSVVQTRQHVSLDLAAGLLVGLAAGTVATWLARPKVSAVTLIQGPSQ
ncbi:phosphatase PAP2 family protein [Cupriavidus basilensis]|uniref:phosphatase PAP2 family protein n=1 Tax=Cupriavidus basilensis TaxID=68895 RepID=UPI0039F6AE3D